MKDLLKNSGFILLGILLLILFITNRIGSCTDKHTDNLITTTDAKVDKQRAIDSVTLAFNKLREQAIDSAIDVSTSKITYLEVKVSKSNKEAKDLKAKNSVLLDSLEKRHTLENCDKVVEMQQLIISEQDTTIIELSNEAEEYSRANYLLTEKIKIKDINLSIAQEASVRDSTIIEQYRTNAIKTEKRNKAGRLIRNGIILIETVLLILK